jgi:hypothetical protein
MNVTLYGEKKPVLNKMRLFVDYGTAPQNFEKNDFSRCTVDMTSKNHRTQTDRNCAFKNILITYLYL